MESIYGEGNHGGASQLDLFGVQSTETLLYKGEILFSINSCFLYT